MEISAISHSKYSLSLSVAVPSQALYFEEVPARGLRSIFGFHSFLQTMFSRRLRRIMQRLFACMYGHLPSSGKAVKRLKKRFREAAMVCTV